MELNIVNGHVQGGERDILEAIQDGALDLAEATRMVSQYEPQLAAATNHEFVDAVLCAVVRGAYGDAAEPLLSAFKAAHKWFA